MELDNLVADDRAHCMFRVHRSSMTSPAVLDLERRRIFDRCWLYLGHESELPHTGDFRRRTIAGRPLIFVRDHTGAVRALYNTCTHRGARVCRQDEGNAQTFQCFYHAWTFNTAGELVGVPDEGGYGPEFARAERGLQAPPRLDSYRGFYFVSFNAGVEDLGSYLGDARPYIDLVVDQSEAGMRIVPGMTRYSTQANWKLMVENSIDGYHGLPLHQTYWEFLDSLGGNPEQRTKRTGARGFDLGHGHAVIESSAPYGRPVAVWHPLFGEAAKDEIARVRARLVERHGEERAYRMAETIRNLFIYPNLIINDVMAITVRQLWPVAPGEMEIVAWALAPGEESPEMLARRLDSFYAFLGPGGFASPDDVEALEACQEGFAAEEVEWSDISRGMNREEPRQVDEVQMRAFWREWYANIRGLPRGEHDEGRKAAEPAPAVAAG